MAYDSKKSKGRDSMSDLTNAKADLRSDVKQVTPVSRQELATGNGARRVTPSTADVRGRGYMQGNRVVGNQVKVGPNPKGSDILKDPLNTYASATKPAAENPDGQDNRAGRYSEKKAAGRNTGKPRL